MNNFAVFFAGAMEIEKHHRYESVGETQPTTIRESRSGGEGA
jgi:hypothetical protein